VNTQGIDIGSNRDYASRRSRIGIGNNTAAIHSHSQRKTQSIQPLIQVQRCVAFFARRLGVYMKTSADFDECSEVFVNCLIEGFLPFDGHELVADEFVERSFVQE
jgi:hypothetical protein